MKTDEQQGTGQTVRSEWMWCGLSSGMWRKRILEFREFMIWSGKVMDWQLVRQLFTNQ